MFVSQALKVLPDQLPVVNHTKLQYQWTFVFQILATLTDSIREIEHDTA